MEVTTRTKMTTVLALAALASVPLACGGEDGNPAAPAAAEIGEALIVTDQRDAGVTDSPDAAGGGEAGAGLSSGAPSLDVLEQVDPALPSTLSEERGSCGAVDTVPSAGTLDQVNRSVVCLLNAERSSRGLKPLKLNSRLSAGALAHSRDMVRRQFFAHESPEGDRVDSRLMRSRYISRRRGFFVGENIGFGGGAFASPNGIVQAWMESPTHRANILQRRFLEIGIGSVPGSPSGDQADTTTYTTTFGALTAAKRSAKRSGRRSGRRRR